MARIVQKFGGTSVGDLDRIRHVAARVKTEYDRGNEVAVVLSAMSGVTNDLVSQVNAISRLHDTREYDVVVASGEQVTCGLMAIALQDLGVPARSWLGWQVPFKTDDVHGKARIADINASRMIAQFSDGVVAVVTGAVADCVVVSVSLSSLSSLLSMPSSSATVS